MHIRPIACALLCFTLSPVLADHGALNPDVTQSNIHQTICIAGYTKQVRPAASFTNGGSVNGVRPCLLPAPSEKTRRFVSYFSRPHMISIVVSACVFGRTSSHRRFFIGPDVQTTSPFSPIISIRVTRLMRRAQSISTVPMVSLNVVEAPPSVSVRICVKGKR